MRLLIIFILLFFSLNLHAFWFFSPPHYTEAIANPVFPEETDKFAHNTFYFDPNNLQWAVYNKRGERVGLGKAIGGKDFCADINSSCRTVVGSFTIFRKEDADCTSKTFPIDEGGGAPMPHCMFFHKGYAIHGSTNLPDKNVSHGCIRVKKEAAKWMSKNYLSAGSTVVVLPYIDN